MGNCFLDSGWRIRTVHLGGGPVMECNFTDAPFLPAVGHIIMYNKMIYRVTTVLINYDAHDIEVLVESAKHQDYLGRFDLWMNDPGR